MNAGDFIANNFRIRLRVLAEVGNQLKKKEFARIGLVFERPNKSAGKQ